MVTTTRTQNRYDHRLWELVRTTQDVNYAVQCGVPRSTARGWLKVAKISRACGLPVCSLGMQELHVSSVSSQPHGGWMEVHSFEIDRYTQRGLVLDNHRAVAPDTPGIGVEFDWGALSPFQVAGESLKEHLL